MRKGKRKAYMCENGAAIWREGVRLGRGRGSAVTAPWGTFPEGL